MVLKVYVDQNVNAGMSKYSTKYLFPKKKHSKILVKMSFPKKKHCKILVKSFRVGINNDFENRLIDDISGPHFKLMTFSICENEKFWKLQWQ